MDQPIAVQKETMGILSYLVIAIVLIGVVLIFILPGGTNIGQGFISNAICKVLRYFSLGCMGINA